MPTSLDTLTQLARDLLDAEDAVLQAERALKDANERARIIREETIPNICLELGITDLKLKTGEQLKIKREVYCSLSKERKEDAFSWLTANKHDGLIKTFLSIEFGKGGMKKALRLADQLVKKGMVVDLDQSVHHSTLKSFVTEQIEAGAKIPLDLFGARPVWTTKLLMEKTKKGDR